MLDGRPTRDPKGGTHLAGDDHRESGLAEARWAGEQDVVWYAPAVPGCLKNQTELVADPRLPLELAQSAGSEHGFGGTLGRLGVRTYERGEVVIAHVTHLFLHRRAKLCSAARIKTATLICGSSRASCSTSLQAASASLAGQPSPWSPCITCPRQAAGGPTVDGESSAGATALILSFSSMTIRCAPLRPMPGTLHSWTRFSVAMARRNSSGVSTASAVCASFGPTPVAVIRSSKNSRSSAEAKPYSVSESSRTINDVASLACWPNRSPATVLGLHAA